MATSTYYHIARLPGVLTQGQLLELDPLPINDPAIINDLDSFVTMFPIRLSKHGYRYLFEEPTSSNERGASAIIESLAEAIRQAHYPTLPSRFSCFFGWEKRLEAEWFIREFGKSEKGSQSEIWRVSCESPVFRGDISLLSLGENWASAFYNLHRYWRGERFVANSPVEVLMSPPVKILKKIRVIDH